MIKKRLVLIVLVVLLILAFGLYVLTTRDSNKHRSVARNFAEALIVDKSLDKAYSLVSEKFKSSTTRDDLGQHLESIKSNMADVTAIKEVSSEQKDELRSETFVEPMVTTFSFSSQGREWIIIVETNSSTEVNRYSVRLAGVDG